MILKILVISDREEPYIWDHFEPERFKDVELILSCGDVKQEYLSFLVTMIKAPLFYVHGNHDGRYLDHRPEGCTSVDGRLFVYRNIRILGLGGSYMYNHGHFQYTEKQMERRILLLKPGIIWNRGFDIFISHAPASGIGDGRDLCHRGFNCFTRLIDSYSPRYFIHGHQHLNYGNSPRLSQYENTTVINAYGYHLFDYDG